jgi:hypothetical protein
MTDKFSPEKPYRVVYGYGAAYEDFHTISEALAFYARTPRAETPINLDRYDSGHPGLTAEEREAVELAECEK